MQDEEELDVPTIRLRRVRKEAARGEGDVSGATTKQDGDDANPATDPMSWRRNGVF